MNKAKEEIISILKKLTKLKQINLEIPPNPNFGDYAFPCFQASKNLKKNPIEIAKTLSEKIKPINLIQETRVAGPYLNFIINKQNLAKLTITNILKKKEKYGSGKDKKKTYMVEYFHANTHKGLHIGHIRNISMAEALCRILEKDGYKVIRANYQGDIGLHVAKCIWGYLNLGKKEPKTNKGTWLGKLYVLAYRKAAEDKNIMKEVKQINNKLYARDKELIKVWKKTKQYCLDEFNDFYKEFDVKFNRLYFESEAEEPGKKIVNNMLKKGIAEESEGAIIINLEKYNLGIYILITQDGNALYSAKDLGLAELKQKEFKFDKSIHITGSEQILHFQQLFKTFEIIGSPMAKKSLHVPYGLVMLPEGKMSSRAGTIVLFDELKEKLFKAAEKAIKKRHKDLSKKEIEKRTKQIAYGALKFSMTNKENNRDIIFDWEKALDFEGETGPYCQYAHARICSVLKKHGKKVANKANLSLLTTPEEGRLILELAKFPDIVEETATTYKPMLLARYTLNLAQSFNEFYHACRILQADKETKKARLFLILATKQILANALSLLGIPAPEQM